MATTIGVAVVWGVPTARQAGTGFTTTGSKYENGGESKEIKNADGETKTWVTWDEKEMLDLDVFPSGAVPGTLPGFGDTVEVASVKYKFVGGEETSNNESEQKMSFRLKKWGANITIT